MNESKRQGQIEIDMTINRKLQVSIKEWFDICQHQRRKIVDDADSNSDEALAPGN